jgi:putative nucleotidyltransferase with HDIG domain
MSMYEKIESLPTLPIVIEKLNNVIYNPQTSAKEVAKILSTDPALSTKILRIVNSAFYGLPNRITSITHAIIMLGFNSVKNIALSSSVIEFFKKEGGNLQLLQEIWKHSIGVAVSAKVLAKFTGQVILEEFFLCGLLHDIGKIVFCAYEPDKFTTFCNELLASNSSALEIEKSIFGADHQEVGNMLFEKWNMPKILKEIASYHHFPLLAPEYTLPTSIVCVADNIAKALSFGDSGNIYVENIAQEIVDTLNLANLNWEQILSEIKKEYEAAVVFMELL